MVDQIARTPKQVGDAERPSRVHRGSNRSTTRARRLPNSCISVQAAGNPKTRRQAHAEMLVLDAQRQVDPVRQLGDFGFNAAARLA